MGQQHRKVVKRTRRKAYLERKKARAKLGLKRNASRTAKAAGSGVEKKIVRKAAVKKAAKPAAEAAPKKAAPKKASAKSED